MRLAAILLLACTVPSAGADPSHVDPATPAPTLPAEAGGRADPFVTLPAEAPRPPSLPASALAGLDLDGPGSRPVLEEVRPEPGLLDSRETDKLLSMFSVFGPAGLIYATFLFMALYIRHRQARQRVVIPPRPAPPPAAASRERERETVGAP